MNYKPVAYRKKTERGFWDIESCDDEPDYKHKLFIKDGYEPLFIENPLDQAEEFGRKRGIEEIARKFEAWVGPGCEEAYTIRSYLEETLL